MTPIDGLSLAGWRAVLGAAIALWLAPAAHANVSSCATDPPPKPSPRLVRVKVDGLYANVLLPSDYRTSGRRYPVLYLLHALDYNENTWLDQTDVARFTRGFTGSRATIVVMPDGGPQGWYTDWPNGSESWQTYHLRRLIPAIDARFRTRANRAHRAVAGFSMGGYGALLYAARRPDLFSVAGGFSPISHITAPDKPYTGAPPSPHRRGAGSPGPAHRGRARRYRPPDDQNSGCNGGSDQWGSGVRDVHWHGSNPTDLVSNFRGGTAYVASGNAVPCDASDPFDRPSFLEPGDAGTLTMTRDYYVPAAERAGVHVVRDFYGCGVHTLRYAERDLHAFWPVMLGAFGRSAPRSFDYRAIDPDFAVRHWAFHADPRRALEFLEARRVGRRGLTLTGSGTETVVTARLFRPGRRVHVTGARPAHPRADRHGRLTLRVDLGPPHTDEQFSGPSQPAFVMRVVTLSTSRP